MPAESAKTEPVFSSSNAVNENMFVTPNRGLATGSMDILSENEFNAKVKKYGSYRGHYRYDDYMCFSVIPRIKSVARGCDESLADAELLNDYVMKWMHRNEVDEDKIIKRNQQLVKKFSLDDDEDEEDDLDNDYLKKLNEIDTSVSSDYSICDGNDRPTDFDFMKEKISLPYLKPVNTAGSLSRHKSVCFPIDLTDSDYTTTTPKKEVDNGKGRRVVRWCMTYNNPKVNGKEFEEFLINTGIIKGFVFQLEAGAKGVPHFQGYLETNERLSTLKLHTELAPHKVSLLHAKGSKKSNIAYCTKNEGKLGECYIWGTCLYDEGQGKRNDMNNFAAAVLEAGGINDDIIDEYAGHALRYHKHAEQLVNLTALAKSEADDMAYWAAEAAKQDEGLPIEGQRQRHLELYFGPTAVGKTTAIKIEVKGRMGIQMFDKNCANKWWCGYKGQKAVLMDEFKGDSFGSVEDFNYITNIGCQQVETKGGQTVMNADNMYFTTNKHPMYWWKRRNGEGTLDWTDARFRAVARRFKKVVWWNDAKEKTVLMNPGPCPVEYDGPIARAEKDAWDMANAEWIAFWKWRSGMVFNENTPAEVSEKSFTLF